MSVSWSRLTLLAGLTALVGCGPSQPTVDLAAEGQAIRDASTAWLAAEQAKDYAKAAANFAEDGIAYPGEQDPLVGPAAIQAYYEADAAKKPNETFSWTVDGVAVAASGDMAVETGSWMSNNEGKEQRGKYVTTWKKVGGVWKVATDMSVSTTPAAVDSTAAKKTTSQ